MSIKDKAMLVQLSISSWTARKYDRKVSREIAESHGTDTDVGRYNKKLMSHAKSYDAITKVTGEISRWHRTNTLPWSQDGPRILASANYFDYMASLREHRDKFESSVSEFCHEYSDLKEQAKRTLNGLYIESDYPLQGEIRDRFSLQLSVSPLPSAEDFRVDLGAEEVARIKKGIEDQVHAAQVIAMKELWTRLHGAVSRLVERLSDPKATFKNTLITNLRDLCELLPKMNLTGDPDLEDARARIETAIASHNPDDLRKNKVLRADVASEASKIQDLMGAYMGGSA